MNRSTHIVTTSNAPVRMPANSAGSAASLNPFCRITMANSPNAVPQSVPRPPKIEVPPRTTAVIAINS